MAEDEILYENDDTIQSGGETENVFDVEEEEPLYDLPKEEYFAKKSTDEIGDEILTRVKEYREHIHDTGLFNLWRKCHHAYYAGYFTNGEIQKKGENKEKREVVVNEFRNVIRHLLSLTMQQRPNFEPKAINTDYRSQSETLLAKGLLDYYMSYENFEQIIEDAVESALVYSEGTILVQWDETKGDPAYVAQDDMMLDVTDDQYAGDVLMSGDLDFKAYPPTRIAREYRRRSSTADWYIVTEEVNKFTLASEYPQFMSQIMDCEPSEMLDITLDDDFLYSSSMADEGDITAIHTLIHKPTSSIPKGRLVKALDDGTVIYDGDLPYSYMPVINVRFASRSESAFGYSVSADLLVLQDMINALDSTITTNQNAFGQHTILIPKGADIEPVNISKGLRAIQYPPGTDPPRTLELLRTSPEIFNYLGTTVGRMETLSGINSVTRGNPEANLKSGAALALVQSMAIQFSNGLQRSYVRMLEQVGTLTIDILKRYARTPRVALIAGKSNRSYLKQFKGDDLKNISRVVVDMGSPLQRTVSGRTQLAESLLEKGFIETPEQYLQVINTGRLEPITEGVTSELMLIKAENEKLLAGEIPPVLVTDDHKLHIPEHQTVLASPEAREDAMLVASTTAHIQSHIEELKTADPALLQMLRQPSLASQTTVNESAMQPGSPAELLDPSLPIEGDMPNMPNMPKNPLSGEEFNLQDGGLPQ